MNTKVERLRISILARQALIAAYKKRWTERLEELEEEFERDARRFILKDIRAIRLNLRHERQDLKKERKELKGLKNAR